MITFLLSGFWHGAAWNFLIWGGLNGLAILPETLRSAKQTLKGDDVPAGDYLFPPLCILIRIVGTFLLTCLLWVFFRARTLSDALTVLQRIGLDAFNVPAYHTLFAAISSACPIGRKVLLLIVVLVYVEWMQREHPCPLTFATWSRPVRWLAYTGLLWVTVYGGTHNPVQFIYFQF
jgi:D-alanyl-lipoteichoic acid acyltransferase DltB (MBOAT superfamily)